MQCPRTPCLASCPEAFTARVAWKCGQGARRSKETRKKALPSPPILASSCAYKASSSTSLLRSRQAAKRAFVECLHLHTQHTHTHAHLVCLLAPNGSHTRQEVSKPFCTFFLGDAAIPSLALLQASPSFHAFNLRPPRHKHAQHTKTSEARKGKGAETALTATTAMVHQRRAL